MGNHRLHALLSFGLLADIHNGSSCIQGGGEYIHCQANRGCIPLLREPVAEKCRNLVLAAGIVTLQGEGIFHLSTEVGGLTVANLDRPQIFTCTIPKLMLRGGYYSINFFLSSSAVVADWLQDAFRFQVEDSDLYGAGKLPPEGYSAVLTDFNWSAASE